MGSTSGRDTAALRDRLESEARRLEFLQAVRLLHRAAPEREALGGDGDPHREVARVRADVSLTFPRSDVVSIGPPSEPGGPPELTVAFLGAATPGSYGSLPIPYVEQILEQERSSGEPVIRDFLDCFNHRMASLYYRAFEKYQATVALETRNHDYFERAFRGVLGLATAGLKERLALPDEALFSRAGLLAMAPLPVVALQGVIRSYFDVPVRIEQFLPAWYTLDAEERSRLGAAFATLGSDLALGARVRLAEYRFRVRLGPLTLSQYEEFLPGTGGFAALFDLVRVGVTPEQTFEVKLVLRKDEVPPLELSETSRCRLGRTTWLSARDGVRVVDADDAVFHSEVFAIAKPSANSRMLEEAA
jgi:type VI secretion system protein ImpH